MYGSVGGACCVREKLREATIAVQDRLFLQTKEVIEGEFLCVFCAQKFNAGATKSNTGSYD